MPSRRYYIATAPIDHINGKMAPQWQKCPNTTDPEQIEVDGFWYGYRLPFRPEISRYAIRKLCRDLNDHPYTAAEEENRILFTSSLHAVYEHKRIQADWDLMMQDFKRQDQYKTPIGYSVAACRSNGGEWLENWIA